MENLLKTSLNNIKIVDLENALKKAGHNLFKNDTKNCNLNLIGVRDETPSTNLFNDVIIVAWIFEGIWNIKTFAITTLAGLHWLKKPMNPKGCAILKEGRYNGAWRIALHREKYKALCQIKPVEVFRDNNKDSSYDYDVDVQSGLFGINIHRASKYNVLPKVNKYSAGCQVFQDPKDWTEFMKIVEVAREHWGNEFTYTLINEKHF